MVKMTRPMAKMRFFAHHVPKPGDEQQQAGDGHHVAQDHPLDGGEIHPQACGQGGQGHVDDAHVQGGHEHHQVHPEHGQGHGRAYGRFRDGGGVFRHGAPWRAGIPGIAQSRHFYSDAAWAAKLFLSAPAERPGGVRPAGAAARSLPGAWSGV